MRAQLSLFKEMHNNEQKQEPYVFKVYILLSI